jgi:hypothetical protein
MKTKLFKISSIFMLFAILVISSCNDTERFSASDSQDIAEEAVTDSYFQDVDDMGAVAIQTPSDPEFNGGRTKGTIEVNDNRFRCDGDPLLVTFDRGDGSTPDHPRGVITVDFGTTGCTDLRGNIRKGKVIFTFNGRRFVSGSTIITTFDNYSINNIKLEGTRTTTNETATSGGAPRFHVVLENGLAIFEDGREASRESDFTWQWIRAANPVDDRLIIEGGSSASGTTRNERDYTVDVLEELEYKRFCGIAVSGIKQYVIDGSKEINIDYGDGTCDRSVTVTVNGVTRNVNVD